MCMFVVFKTKYQRFDFIRETQKPDEGVKVYYLREAKEASRELSYFTDGPEVKSSFFLFLLT